MRLFVIKIFLLLNYCSYSSNTVPSLISSSDSSDSESGSESVKTSAE